MLLTTGGNGPIESLGNKRRGEQPIYHRQVQLRLIPAQARPINGQIGVTLQRSASIPTSDLGLWAAIRAHEKAISFGGIGKGPGGLRGYQGFIEQVLCGDPVG
jgi:hypothetical protein